MEHKHDVKPQNDQVGSTAKDVPNATADPPVKKPGSKGPGRKRTKSGCLTCRKRRIKCGEERPTCQNCIKSKRKCEGYNQRLVFKDPQSTFRPTWAGTSEMIFSSRGGPQKSKTTQQGPVHPPTIAPRPPGFPTDYASPPPSNTQPPLEFVQHEYPSEQVLTSEAHQHQAPSSGHTPSDTTSHHSTSGQSPSDPAANVSPQATQFTFEHYQPSHYDFDNLTKIDTAGSQHRPGQLSPLDVTTLQSSSSNQSGNELYVEPSKRYLTQTYSASNLHLGETFYEHPYQHAQYSNQVLPTPAKTTPSSVRGVGIKYESSPSAGYSDHMEDDEEDPWDVSDEDMLDEESQADLRYNEMGVVVALQASRDGQALRMRSMLDFIDRPDMLATYAPSMQSSPLRDPMAARLFCHFINVTAPIISLYERHPANASAIFQGTPIPKSQQHIWTYVYPTLALRNSALLHAMLALAALHVSQLQDVPVTKSLRHYHISLRRVAKSLGNDAQRAKPATLAAAMLLSFYELWCADHQKWSNHLLGAKHLLININFAKYAKHIKLNKLKRREQQRAQDMESRRLSGSTFIDDRTHYQTYIDDVDENIVSMLTGKRLRYDEYGQILDDDDANDADTTTYTEKDLDNHEIQRDVYWWYAKQDVYQSILGGGRLFMPYDLWSRCPPRAPIGRLNAVYGTYDHLMLLMARIADFAAKDLLRKRRAAKAQGGWRPPPGMGPPGPPGASGRSPTSAGPPPNMMPPQMGQPSNPAHSQMPSSQMPPGQMPQGPQRSGPPRGPPSMPSFPGMLPTFGEARLPMGFDRQYREPTPPSATSSTSSESDLSRQLLEAEEEWQEIRSMFTFFAEHLGEDFQPLGPEYATPISTPFGLALQYKTSGIAGIWMNFYMGLIACHRAHPSMPPAAMMAAGIAARQTGFMANEVGRIAAALAPEIDVSTMKTVSPFIGAVLIESTAPLFIAAVQYQDPAQRLWTVTRLINIARLSGWQTARAIATGCETSWVKTGEAGMGPPWSRKVVERGEEDKEGIWSTGRRADRAGQDRGFEGELVVARTDRVYYALGVLGLEKDFDRLEVGEMEREDEEFVKGERSR